MDIQKNTFFSSIKKELQFLGLILGLDLGFYISRLFADTGVEGEGFLITVFYGLPFLLAGFIFSFVAIYKSRKKLKESELLEKKEINANRLVLAAAAISIVWSIYCVADPFIIKDNKIPAVCYLSAFRNICFSQTAKNIKNENVCKKIPESRERNACLLTVARVSNRVSVCEAISGDENREKAEECFEEYVAKNQDMYVCEKAPKKDNCFQKYFTVFESLSDSVCESVESVDACWKGLAVAREDAVVCARISYFRSQPLKNKCFAEVADKKNDILPCDSIDAINDYAASRDCLDGAIKWNWKSLGISPNCDGLSQFREKEYCYYLAGLKLGDSSVCGNIQDEELRSACFNKKDLSE